ncbi:MAG: excinuclease ABC subunit UvrA, partial [bacterium]
NNPRSTVATITEIYDYLRILFARIGKPHCLECGREIKKLSKEEILETIINTVSKIKPQEKLKEVLGVEINSNKIRIFSPVVVGRKGEYYQLLYDLLEKGYEQVKIDGEMKKLRNQIILAKNKKHDIDVLVDEFYVSEFSSTKLGTSKNAGMDPVLQRDDRGGKNIKEEKKGNNSCKTKDPSQIKNQFDGASNEINVDIKTRLSDAVEKAIEESKGLLKIETPEETKMISVKFMCPYDGYSYPEIEPRLFSFNSPYGACPECNGLGTKEFFSDEPCEKCKGARLREEALHIFIGGQSIVDYTAKSITDAKKFLEEIKFTELEQEISKVILKEIDSRLEFMINVGIEYLSLNRRANTLSGGEAQRIRLASQLGSGLVGALYVLDEPTIGLHQKDNDKLIGTLTKLRDLGNTIIVVEHDEDTMFASDFLVDIGPGAGVHGGEVVVSGYMDELLMAKDNKSGSITLDYLRGDRVIELPEKRRDQDKGKLKIRGGKIFNIKNMNIDLPLGKFVCVTGVSGSGKSSFVYEILYKNLQGRLERKYRTNESHNCESFSGSEYVGRTIMIDQSPIGRTPRSNPATYTGSWTFIRDMFATTVMAKERGWQANRFSFNVKGGRCEACQGNGTIEVEMHFLPTVYVPCDICRGKRFTKETLEVKFKGKNVHQVLEMTAEEALEFFIDLPAIYDRLKCLNDVGLGYLKLGQSATTLSGGEAQRVKIASELYRPHLHKT